MATNADAWGKAGLRYEVIDSVAWLTLNRPERRNAMDHYPGGSGPNGMGLRDALLEAIKSDLVLQGKFDEYREHYERLASINRAIEKTIARRYSLEQYREWLVETGFEIVRSEPKYFDAVEVIHARKL